MGLTAHKSSIGSGQQDVGPSGVATGCGATKLSSSSPVGMKKTLTDGVSLYYNGLPSSLSAKLGCV
ncbi:hypothetical protein [Rummeliibacillus suwonensis]|uniref:hypothetical protein n=1 Tax=Rummeliibacillus suwonensis TaxID=1306154 RepID=UPI0011B35BF6|nr:hypothetical protein [Rummeliibacillus suwonensis]MBO2534459.1 hypothetical protein [Rummeliibacillus suwonensis]